jgi:hypothetical protein
MEWSNIVISNQDQVSVLKQGGFCYRKVHAHNIEFLLYIKEIYSITHELTETRMQFFNLFYNQNFKFRCNATLYLLLKDLIVLLFNC